MPFLGVTDTDEPRGASEHTYLNVGVEVEILVRPREWDPAGQGLGLVAEYLSVNHNTEIPKGQRKMHSEISGSWEGEKFSEWSLTNDRSIKGGNPAENTCQCAPAILESPRSHS